jgi:hypothetical protein
MAVVIRDQHLEERIDRERQRRGDATMAKTLADLVREKLTEIARDVRDEATGEGRAVAHSGFSQDASSST